MDPVFGTSPVPALALRANIEGTAKGVLHGWAWHPDQPDRPALLRVTIDDAPPVTIRCDGFRADLAQAGIRDGRAAIAWPIPDRFQDGAEHDLLLDAPQAPDWPGYRTRFRLTLPAFGPGPRLGAGEVLFEGTPLPAMQDGAALASAAVVVAEGLAILDAFRHAPPPAIVIPVHNAAPDLARCLDAVLRHSDGAGMILVVDDASTDPAIPRILAEAASRDPRLRLLRNPQNLGYTSSANRGLAATAPADVVLLNSDTIVTPGWLRRLRATASRRPRIGSVTPLSDNAGAFSVPEMAEANVFPAGYTPDQLGRAIGAASPGWAPLVPTGNGFCLYLRRAMLEDVGPFDTDGFPRGYGEENDLCMRALRRGWDHLVEDRTLVLHARSRSFGAERGPLQDAANQVLEERWPDYRRRIRAFRASPLLQAARAAIGTTLRGLEQAPLDPPPEATRPRILFVIHTMEDGGTAFTTLDLMRGLAADFTCLVLVQTPEALRLLRHDAAAGALEEVGAWTLGAAPELFEPEPRDYTALLTTLLVREGIALVHVRHLLRHSLGLPGIAAALGIPVILSFHDFYFVCPTVNLLDEQGRYCGGVCTEGGGAEGGDDCATVDPWPAGLPPLKHRMIAAWRDLVRAALPHAAACVTTSESARSLLLRHYPQLAAPGAAPFHVIEHGRDFPEQRRLAVPPPATGPIRILVPGHMTSRHKGGSVVEALKALDAEGRLELHFLGNAPADYARLGTCHGIYRREDFARLVAGIRPSLALLPTIWPETYSHTLSECWACGVPVIGSGLGAVGDRIRRWGGGWLVAPDDAAGIRDLALRLAADHEAWEAEAARARVANLRRVDEMARDYRVLYRRAMAGAIADRGAARVLRVGVVVPDAGAVPAVARARWLVPLRHPALLTVCDVAPLPEVDLLTERLAATPDDVIVVPRLGSPALAEALGALRASGATVICDHALPHDAGGLHLGRAATRLVAAGAEPLPALTGLLDERPWLRAGARWQRRRGSPPAGGALSGTLVCVVGAVAETTRVAWAAISAWAVRSGRPILLLGRDLEPLPGAAAVLAIPPAVVDHAALADWLGSALPVEVGAALSLPGGGTLGAAPWAIFGLPVLPLDTDPDAGLLADGGCPVLAEDPDGWMAALDALAARGLPNPQLLRDAVLDQISLRQSGSRIVSALPGDA